MRIDGLLEKDISLDYPLVLDGKEYKDIAIREYVGTDEEFVSQDNIREDIIAVENIAVSRCIAEVKGTELLPKPEDIGKLPVSVVENLMLEIRKITYGNSIKHKGNCSQCKRALVFEEMIDTFFVKKNVKDSVITLRTPVTRGGKKYHKCFVKPVSNESRGVIFDKDGKIAKNKINSTMYLSCIIRIENETDPKDFIVPTLNEVSALTKYDRQQIADNMGSVESVDSSVDYLCPYCNTNNPVNLPVFDFLF